MNQGGNEHEIEKYRSYLMLLARMQLDVRLQSKVEPSDMVQRTLLEAYAKRDQYVGDAAGFGGWLAKALANNVRDELRRQRRKKRDIARERSIDAMLRESSSVRLAECLAAMHPSPSNQAAYNEELLKLSDAILALPEAQREAVVLHHLHGWTLSEIARHLVRTDAAVAGLLHRGMRRLRELLKSMSCRK